MKDIQTPPRTIMEVFRSLPEGTLAEVINGNLYMSPSPSANHQRILRDLVLKIASFLNQQQLGEVFLAPFDVFLDEQRNAVQPDIIYVAKENSSVIKDDAIHGVPDLVVEVLSPNNEKYDLVKKKELYEKCGVKEYWVVNPDTKDALVFFLKDGSYGDSAQSKGYIKSRVFSQEFQF